MTETLIYTSLEVLIALGCCLGNVLVIWAVWSCRALSQTTFCFVASLAVADLLVGAVVVPFAVVVDGHFETSFHCCLFLSCVVIVLTQASVHSLLAIAVDRYLRVYNPLRYRGAVKKKHLWAAVTVCWLSAFILGFIPMFGWHNPTTENSTITCDFITVIDMSYMVNFNFLACNLPPTIIMMILYLLLFNMISKQLRKGIGRGMESRSFYRKERKLANSLALVLVLFAICWLPLHIMNTLNFYKCAEVPSVAFHIGILLSHANSAINPVVYAFKVPKIKMAYKRILKMLTSSEKEDQSSQTLDNNASSNSNSTARCTMKIKPQVVLIANQDG
ncbi:hypothetical protein QQF64_028184 [Cirrhinus molitorella]|uniref:Uncharacterized protein n=2 Tax=Cirrhinus molitorella TaxID=172907 RepID=A0AA88TK97_9TELE|nr:hypothetical protein Q8A67_014990 [Cirrhinus molitorella]